jgi:hypothetical protein
MVDEFMEAVRSDGPMSWCSLKISTVVSLKHCWSSTVTAALLNDTQGISHHPGRFSGAARREVWMHLGDQRLSLLALEVPVLVFHKYCRKP